jgi:hypothetical protein
MSWPNRNYDTGIHSERNYKMVQDICGGQNDIEISLRALYLFLFSYMDPRI